MPVPTRILLVEDNPSDRQFMDACIHDGGGGVELHHASRLADASSSLKQQHFELIIADLNLPDGEGLETFFKVKELATDAAIVVMTGMDDAGLATRAVQAGAQDYLVKGDLSPQKVWQSVSNALQRQGQLRKISVEARDLRKKNSSLREMAYTDNLTGTPNRRGLAKILALTEPCDRTRNPPTHALLVDVDDFKAVNDIFGHSRGDQALKELGRRIRALLRPSDTAARVGGDEFMVLISAADIGEAVAFADGIRASIADAGSVRPFRVTVSVGVAALERRPYTVEELLDLTRGVLRLSKGGGKNRVCFDAGLAGRDEVPALVRVPFFEIHSRRVAGYRFTIPERSGGSDSGPQSVEEVRGMLRAAQTGGGGLECHLEISHLQLMRLNPGDLVLGDGFEPWRFRLSIPEIPMSPLPSGLVGAIRRLQRSGWGLGLRGLDLGAHGWANLILLEPSVVTLDAALVGGIAADHERMRSVLRLRRALSGLGADIVADGVESAEDLKALDQMGIGYASGPFLTGGR